MRGLYHGPSLVSIACARLDRVPAILYTDPCHFGYTTNRMVITLVSVAQIILAILLVLVVLLQQKGTGLGAAFGGASGIYSTRRGIDAILYKATIIISILFFGISLLRVVL